MRDLPPVQSSHEPAMGLIQGFEAATLDKLPVGTVVKVGEGTATIVVIEGKPIAVLEAGDRVLDPALIPALSPYERESADGTRTIPAALWRIKTEKAEAVWQSERILARKDSGLSADCVLHGTCWLRITDPARFYSEIMPGVHKVKQFQDDPAALIQEFPSFARSGRNPQELAKGDLPAIVDCLVVQTIEDAVDEASAEARLTGGEEKTFLEPLRAHAGTAVAQKLSELGLHCTAFGIDRVERHTAVCRVCNHAEPQQGYQVPICHSCRTTLVKRPFPLWVIGTAAAAAILLLVSFTRFPSSVQAGVAYERGKHDEEKRDYTAAIVEYRKVVARFPSSLDAQARLGIAEYRSGDIGGALGTLEKLEGKEIGKELTAEVEGIFNELDSRMTAEKAKKGAR
jgi:hypothetical protein